MCSLRVLRGSRTLPPPEPTSPFPAPNLVPEFSFSARLAETFLPPDPGNAGASKKSEVLVYKKYRADYSTIAATPLNFRLPSNFMYSQ